jgi:maltose alpha-D-glucosyltransferase/alpha-amylase
VLDLWYKNAIIYSLNVATFMDGNDDGIGDFKGLTSRLDHISQLGATCIWLLPFYPSPRLDHGYDVTNYYDVAPELGSLGDFVEFSHQARLRGLRLIIDLPINHTSEQHPWFQQARASPRSPFRDYYIWSKERPRDPDSGVVFPGYQSSVWNYDSRARAWYFHRFYPHQPDLNITSEAVRDEIYKIVGFWLELGVSGFRIDAAPFVIDEVRPDKPTLRHYEFFSELRDFLSWRKGDAILLAEANVPLDEMANYFGGGARIHMLFAFLLNQYLFLTMARQEAAPLAHGFSLLPKLPQLGQWAQFLRNHDELDLGRLTVEEREDCYRRFAADPDTRLYERGIRRRLAPMLGGDRRRIELAFSLMFSLPGTPVIYYGDELGMGDTLALPERWPVRTCMQWTDGTSAGFSGVDEEMLIHPAIMDGHFGARRVNVAAQQRDPQSLLSWMRRLVDARESCPEIGWGEIQVIEADNPAVFVHRIGWNGGAMLALHNLRDQPVEVQLGAQGSEVDHKTEIFADRTYRTDRLVLEPFGYRWFRLGR